jgi:ribosomal protein S6
VNAYDTQYIVEFAQHGRSIKVTAFDPQTLTEASVVGAQGATKQQLAELAIRKLRYVIEKNKQGN